MMYLIDQKKKDFPIIWYDQGKTMYTRQLLSDITEPIQIQIRIRPKESICIIETLF